MSFSLFIPAKNSHDLIILWENLSFLNYFRAIVHIIGISFIPGSLIYKIVFKNDPLSTKFKINPFFIKITIYPLISFGFIGVSVLILDQINLRGELIGIFLFIFILALFFLELILEKVRSNSLNIKYIKINISKYTFIVLLLALGVATISIGFQISWKYLISGDPWDALKYASYVGDIGKSPLYIDTYPNFWGYISFGLSNLGGLPYININTLLAPFSYLFITSIYLLMKALLYQFKTKYVILTTLLMSIFSGLLINPLASSLIFVGEYYFIYKSYSYCLLFVGMAIFLVILKNLHRKDSNSRIKHNREALKFISLSALFLVLNFITYIIPLLFGIIFILLYCIFSKKEERDLNFKYSIYFFVFIFLFLLIIDILMNFYLSFIIVERLVYFFNFEFISYVLKMIPKPLLTYSIYSAFLLITFIIYKIMKVFNNRKIRKRASKLNFKTTFIILLIIFTFFLLIEFSSIILENVIQNLDLSKSFFFFLFLDKIFLNIGLIGILGVYFSYFCWKRDKFLFLTLAFWILISFIIAFIRPIIEFLKIFPSSPESISDYDVFIMDYWFDRLWLYSIPALCIFTSIGLFTLFKKIKEFKIFKKIRVSPTISKNFIGLTLFFSSFSGIVITGFVYGNPNFRFTNTQIETLSWISENIPIHSGVVVGDNFFMGVGTDSITFVRQYFFYDIFEANFNQTKCIEQIGFLKNETIQYAVISQFFISYFLNKSDFVNNVLVPDFYNITLYSNGDLTVYYAPFFD
ncbi:MAG: hypothetical protein ACFFAN_15290 [Promethearchaeota archaeon]